MSRRAVISGVIALMAGGAALRAVFLRYPYIDSDQAVIGLMGIHILKGEFPIYFWGEPYSGTLESFVAALCFYLFGISRLTLDLVPFVFSLVFLLLTWRLGSAIFDRATGLAGLALAAVPPMLLTWHSVLARGNYIENLVLGNILFLLALRLVRPDLSPAAHGRALWVYGFVSGFAWYMNFQSIHYLIATALFLLWRGQRWLLLRQAWIALSAALVGSLPFWIYNLTFGVSSLGAIRWYTKPASFGEALFLFARADLPILLGASSFRYNFEPLWTRQLPALEWVIVGLYGASFLLGVWSVIGQAERGRGVELILLLPLVVCGVVITGGFRAGDYDPRYLLPIYSSAPLLLGALVTVTARRAPPLAALIAGIVLFSNLYGHLTTAEGLPRYQVHLENDRALFAYMRGHGLRYAFAPEYWFSYRLTFDAQESMIFATPFWHDHSRDYSKYPPYTWRVGQEVRTAYIVWGPADAMEETLKAAGERYEKAVVGRFTLFHHFKPPQPGGRSLPGRRWHLVGGNGREAFDRDPTTRWQGEVTDPLTIDLGETPVVHRISLHLGEQSLRALHGLQVLVSRDGKNWRLVSSTAPLIPGFTWMGDRLILEEHGRIGLSFPPVAARYLKLQPVSDSEPGAWAVDELFVYTEGDEVPLPPDFWNILWAPDHEAKSRLLLESLELIRTAPDLEAAHLRFRILLSELGLPVNWAAIESYLGSRLAREGRWQEAIFFYQRLVERQPFRFRSWEQLKTAYQAVRALENAKRVEAEARHRFTPALPSQVQFGWVLKLVGYQIEPSTVTQGGSIHLILIWQVIRSPRKDYAIFVHVTDGSRRVFGQDYAPLGGAFPTSGWERGDVVRDDQIRIPPGLPPGRYQVRIGVWQPERRAKLRAWQGWLPTWKKSFPLGEVTVIPAKGEG